MFFEEAESESEPLPARFLLVPAVADDYPLLRSINLFVSVLSMCSCLVVVGGYLAFQELRKFFTRLVLYLAIADMWLAAAGVIGHFPNPTSSGCLVQSTFFVFFGVSSFLWSSAISYALRQILFHRSTKSFREMELEGKMHKVCWGVPAVITLCVLTTHGYGPAGFWCWIQGRNSYGSALRFVVFYLPLWMTCAYNVYVYFALVKRLKLLLTSDEGVDPIISTQDSDRAPAGADVAIVATELIGQTISVDARTKRLAFGTPAEDGGENAGSSSSRSDRSGGFENSQAEEDGDGPEDLQDIALAEAAPSPRFAHEEIFSDQASPERRSASSSSCTSVVVVGQQAAASSRRPEGSSTPSSTPAAAGVVGTKGDDAFAISDENTVIGRPVDARQGAPPRGTTSGGSRRSPPRRGRPGSNNGRSRDHQHRLIGSQGDRDRLPNSGALRQLSEAEVEQLKAAQLANLKRLLYFPMVGPAALLLAFCWSFGSLNRLLNWFGFRWYFLDFLTVTFGGLQGFANTCCYFFTNPGVREQVALRLSAALVAPGGNQVRGRRRRRGR